MKDKKLSLTDSFKNFFSVDLAVTPEQIRRVFQVRYRVYCEELRLEPADHFPNGMEFDEFDDKSLHCLITHKRTGLAAGCVRLVTTDDHIYEDPLPLEKHCHEKLSLGLLDSLNRERNRVCEISRLAVDPLFRRRAGEDTSSIGAKGALDFSQQEMRAFSLVAVSGFMAATALAELTGRVNIFAMMQPYLPRLLKRSGIFFKRMGPDIEYHGLRAPYFVTAQSVLDNMRSDLRNFYYEIYHGFAPVYQHNLSEAS